MTTRQKALLASSPGLAVLVLSLGWAILDRHPLHLPDRSMRLAGWIGDHLRL